MRVEFMIDLYLHHVEKINYDTHSHTDVPRSLTLKHSQTKMIQISTICQPTLEVILYGNVNISIDDNKQVILAGQDYIRKTRRLCQ